MRDNATGKRIEVIEGVTTKPYLVIDTSQVEQVRQLLQDHDIPCEVNQDAVSLGGIPVAASFGIMPEHINAVQNLLDSEP